MSHVKLVVALAAFIALPSGAALCETKSDQVDRNGMARLERNDPIMAAAIRKARETLPDFLALVHSPRPTITSYAVKIGIPAGNDTEFFWISPFEERSRRFTGKINNTPKAAKVKFGQMISFSQNDIVDWLYRENGGMQGNYTACAIVEHAPPQERQGLIKQFGLSCQP
jgi:uncharacterized protein YegJ (DUF2314 family)